MKKDSGDSSQAQNQTHGPDAVRYFMGKSRESPWPHWNIRFHPGYKPAPNVGPGRMIHPIPKDEPKQERGPACDVVVGLFPAQIMRIACKDYLTAHDLVRDIITADLEDPAAIIAGETYMLKPARIEYAYIDLEGSPRFE